MNDSPTLADFGQDVWWLVLIKIVGVFGLLVVMTLFAIVFERKVVARMQQRSGPNRVGPRGYLQSLADGLKLAFKEDIMPTLADKPVYFLAPVIATIPAFLAFSVIPLGPEVSILGQRTPLQLIDAPIGVLVVLACSAMGVYGIVLGGWASGSTYPLLGSLRSAAQMVSYEIAMGLSIVAVFLYAGTMSTSGIVAAQAGDNRLDFFGLEFDGPSWYAVLLPVSFIIYVIAVVGETNRAPFDLPEAESELVGGFHTEYSSLKFALFFLAEYVNMVTVSALAATLFLGGWRAPWPISIWDGANSGWWPLLWFLLKVVAALFVFIWLRGTLPRLRYDQFMRFGWKVLVPTALVWILAVATMRTVSREADLSSGEVAVYVGLPIAAVVLAVLLVASRKSNEPTRIAAVNAAAGSTNPTEPEVLPPVRTAAVPGTGRPSAAARPAPRAGSPSRRWTSWCRPRPGWPARSRSPPAPPWRRAAAARAPPPGRTTVPDPTPETSPEKRRGGEVEQAGGTRSAPAPRTSRLPGPAQGFGVTFSTMFKKVTTEQYPDEPKVTKPRYHGRHVLNRHPDGLEKCVGCELCAWACPADAIYVEGGTNTDEQRFSPGERYGRIYQINYLRCIFCGLCIEACPTRSLTMSNDFELADDSRGDLVYTKEQLMAPLLPGMEQPPHPMRLGDDEKDYYLRAGS